MGVMGSSILSGCAQRRDPSLLGYAKPGGQDRPWDPDRSSSCWCSNPRPPSGSADVAGGFLMATRCRAIGVLLGVGMSQRPTKIPDTWREEYELQIAKRSANQKVVEWSKMLTKYNTTSAATSLGSLIMKHPTQWRIWIHLIWQLAVGLYPAPWLTIQLSLVPHLS